MRRIVGVVAVTIAALALTASTAAASGTLTVSIVGVGSVGGSGINCERALKDKEPTGTCSVAVQDETDCDFTRKPPCILIPATASVSAKPAGGFVFDRWSGACTGTDPADCSVTMRRDAAVTAHFRDGQAPAVALDKPGIGPVAGTISLESTATDNVGVSRVEFRVRGALVATDTAAPFQASFNTKSIADGGAGITATAFDAAGLSAVSGTTNVTIDNTAPTLGVAGPNNQSFGPGTTQTWTLTAADTGSGLSQVRCSLVATGAPASFAPCSGGNGGHSVTGRPEGSYRLTVRATDAAGNNTDVVRNFAIDGTPPETTIGSGVGDGGTTFSTTLTWEFSASEPSVRFECRVHPAALTPGAFAPCSSAASHTASGFSPGTYTFEVRAIDAAGNEETTTVKRTFTVEHPPPPPPPAPPADASPDGPAAIALAPATTQLGAPTATASQILVTLAFNFKNSTKKNTRLTSLVVKNIPAGSTVTAKCSKGCSKKSFTKKNASGQVSLKAMIKKSLKVNATIKVVVSKPGSSSAVKLLKIRARKAPLVTTQCQPEGAPKPTSC